MGSIRLAAVARTIAREPVRVDVGNAGRPSVLVGTDEVSVNLTTRSAGLGIATDDGLCESFAFGFSVCGHRDEGRGVDGGD